MIDEMVDKADLKVSDLDAESSSLASDTLELAYSRFQILRV